MHFCGGILYCRVILKFLQLSSAWRGRSPGSRHVRASVVPTISQLEVKDIHDHIGSAIQQNDVSSNQYVRAIGRRRRQPTLKLFGTRLETLLEPWWQGTTPRELFFQPWGQLISFGKSRWKIALVTVIPSTHRFTVMIVIEVFPLVVVISMFVVTFSVSMTLGQCEIARKRENSQYADEHRFCRFHHPLRSEST